MHLFNAIHEQDGGEKTGSDEKTGTDGEEDGGGKTGTDEKTGTDGEEDGGGKTGTDGEEDPVPQALLPAEQKNEKPAQKVRVTV